MTLETSKSVQNLVEHTVIWLTELQLFVQQMPSNFQYTAKATNSKPSILLQGLNESQAKTLLVPKHTLLDATGI